MGLFSRNKVKEEKTIVKRNNEETIDEAQRPAWSYSPNGLGFSLSSYNTNPETLSAFFGGVELISNSVAEVPILVKDYKTKEVIEDHPIITALKYGRINKFNLIKQLVHDVYVYGNGLAYIDRGPNGVKEIIYCPRGSYNILADPVKMRVYYQIPFIKDGATLDSSNVIHIFKNSKDGLTGKGIGEYASLLFPLASAADKSALQFFDSGGNVNGILQSKKFLDTEEKIEAWNEWNNAFRGTHKNGNIVILGNDWEYKQVGVSQKDSQQLETREFNVLEICRYLNISPILLSVNSGATYNNIEQAQLDLVIHTLLPLIELIEEEFNKKVIRPNERGKYYIDFQEENIMFSDRSSTANYFTSLVKNGVISINEARKSLNYTEKEGCDELIIAYTNVNDNKVDGKDENNDENDKNNDQNDDKNKDEKE